MRKDFNSNAQNWMAAEDYYIVDSNLVGTAPPGSGIFMSQYSLRETKTRGTCVASIAVGKTWDVAKMRSARRQSNYQHILRCALFAAFHKMLLMA